MPRSPILHMATGASLRGAMLITPQKHLIERNFTFGRGYTDISEITIHHAAGRGHLGIMFAEFNALNRSGSAHYGVRDSDVYQFVDEADTAWANSNRQANQRAITIEVVNSTMNPDWAVSITTYETLIKLIFDVATRHNLFPLDKGRNLTWHSMYAATVCPGPYLLDRIADIADRVNNMNSDSSTLAELIEPEEPIDYILNPLYRVRNGHNDPRSQQGAFKNFGRAQILVDTLNDGAKPIWFVYNQDGERLYPRGQK